MVVVVVMSRREVGVGLTDEVPVKYVVLGAGKDAAKAASKADNENATTSKKLRSCWHR